MSEMCPIPKSTSQRTKPAASGSKRKVGRPSKYSKALATHIVAELAKGRSLFSICDQDAGMPDRDTVMRWMGRYSDFAALVSRGRQAGAEHSISRIMDISETTTSKNARGNRIRLQAHQWLASKFHPALYGDKAIGLNIKVDLDSLVAGSYELERKQQKLVKAEVVDVKPLDVAPKGDK